MPKTKEFHKLVKSLEEEYLAKPVPKKYQEKYGKVYDEKDIESFAYAVAKSKRIKIDK